LLKEKQIHQKIQFMKMPLIILLISLFFLSCSSKKDETQNTVPADTTYSWEKFSMGADLSYVNELKDYGAEYFDSGLIRDPFAILKSHGTNTVRVRLWHNPQWLLPITGGKLYSDLFDVEKTIKQAKEMGMAIILDIHYSDTWADPSHQETPAAWTGLSLSALKDSVYQYTMSVLNHLKSKSLTPEMVQIGNETNGGMLFPAGQVKNDDWTAFGELLNSGIKAVRDFSAGSSIKPRIILHVAQLQNADWWMTGITQKAKVTNFDILGVSHYSKWSKISRMDVIANTIQDLRSKYGKKVMIVETAYPWTGGNADNYSNKWNPADSVAGYPLTIEGQRLYLTDLTQAVITGGGSGIIYWEPAWITSPMPDKWGVGSSWDNCTLFDFTGNLLPSASYLNTKYNF
jgi:arabinogalactan endo-1,4-beta-galactosidase